MTVERMVDRARAQRLALFNHKGGVGKTTLTLNLARAVADQGKRVLVVDSDPQCNLTSHLVEDSVVNDLLDHSDEPEGRTIWSALKPIAEAEGDFRAIPPYELPHGMFLLPGDIRLAEFEQELASLWSECFQRKPKGFRGTTALSSLVNQVAQTQDIDFVFYDSGPNIGPLNRAILLDCDYFVIPAACDLFSVRAIKTLGHTLANWVQDWSTIRELAPADAYLLPGSPHLLGYIPQRFKTHRGNPSAEDSRFIGQIERAVVADVVEVLRRLDPALTRDAINPLRLGDVKDFGTLVSASQREGVAISEVSKGTSAQKGSADRTFEQLALQIIERTSKAEA
jgi:cellulose biosynthesis protein BcsQ